MFTSGENRALTSCPAGGANPPGHRIDKGTAVRTDRFEQRTLHMARFPPSVAVDHDTGILHARRDGCLARSTGPSSVLRASPSVRRPVSRSLRDSELPCASTCWSGAALEAVGTCELGSAGDCGNSSRLTCRAKALNGLLQMKLPARTPSALPGYKRPVERGRGPTALHGVFSQAWVVDERGKALILYFGFLAVRKQGFLVSKLH